MLWEVGNPAYGDGGLTIDFTIWAGGPVTIHWGDGTQETLPTASDQIVSHTYTAPGSYTVQIAGDLKRFRTNANNNNARHAPKLHKVLDWGGVQWTQNNGMFRMAKNLTEVPVDAPNLSRDISTMFW